LFFVEIPSDTIGLIYEIIVTVSIDCVISTIQFQLQIITLHFVAIAFSGDEISDGSFKKFISDASFVLGHPSACR